MYSSQRTPSLEAHWKTAANAVLDFVQVLDSLGNVNNNVRAVLLWTKEPNLA